MNHVNLIKSWMHEINILCNHISTLPHPPFLSPYIHFFFEKWNKRSPQCFLNLMCQAATISTWRFFYHELRGFSALFTKKAPHTKRSHCSRRLLESLLRHAAIKNKAVKLQKAIHRHKPAAIERTAQLIFNKNFSGYSRRYWLLV